MSDTVETPAGAHAAPPVPLNTTPANAPMPPTTSAPSFSLEDFRTEITAAVRSELSKASATVSADVKALPAAQQGIITQVLDFLKHPSLHMAAGLTGAAVAAFTNAVPSADRGGTTALGIAYAIGIFVSDRLGS